MPFHEPSRECDISVAKTAVSTAISSSQVCPTLHGGIGNGQARYLSADNEGDPYQKLLPSFP